LEAEATPAARMQHVFAAIDLPVVVEEDAGAYAGKGRESNELTVSATSPDVSSP
jgi:hypothetical protein